MFRSRLASTTIIISQKNQFNIAKDTPSLNPDKIRVILNFPNWTASDGMTLVDGGADFIQRNAFILVKLINEINSMKVGSEQNVIIGPSMGGLISRYALRYMEQNTLDHDTRLYLSFDSPHLGANVPIGLQYLFNYMVLMVKLKKLFCKINQIHSNEKR